MRKLIKETESGHGGTTKLYASLTDCAVPNGYKELKFETQFSGAVDPHAFQSKAILFLDTNAVQLLKELL